MAASHDTSGLRQPLQRVGALRYERVLGRLNRVVLPDEEHFKEQAFRHSSNEHSDGEQQVSLGRIADSKPNYEQCDCHANDYYGEPLAELCKTLADGGGLPR